MSSKLKVLIIAGGQSTEHQVSLQSAVGIYQAINRQKYQVQVLGITQDGRWQVYEDEHFLVNQDQPEQIALAPGGQPITLVAQGDHSYWLNLSTGAKMTFDVVFPIVHGSDGEDGNLQGLLNLARQPFVGCDVTASANAMDKIITKKLLQLASIPVADYLVISRRQELPSWSKVTRQLGEVVFVKPSSQGSSVGVNQAQTAAEFTAAVKIAFEYDHRVLVEKKQVGREIECSVLGNDQPQASLPGEVIPHHVFYSYEAKYIDPDGAGLIAPAKLDEATTDQVRSLALRAYQILGCQGLARVDMFLLADGQVVINELNTLPGFTKISMYPKLWSVSGLNYADLIDRLIELALARAQANRQLRRAYDPAEE